MRQVRLDSVGGASGDLIMGALIELGIPAASIQAAVASLGIEPFQIEAQPCESHHLRGIRVTVHTDAPGRHHHAHRGIAEIRRLLADGPLPEPVRRASLAIFERIAAVEAKIHGREADHVHLHELGETDSIVDIVGCCFALHELGADGITCGPLPVGCGTIRCAHGLLPNPAPATAELLAGFMLEQTDEPFELVTPTGAALLAHWRAEPPAGGMRLLRAGYSFGHYELRARPNLLRACLLEADAGPAPADTCLVLECNLDDTTPEILGALLATLIEAGALDAFFTPVQMKKNRPAVLLTVLCRPDQREAMLDTIFHGCTTFGVREYPARRAMLARRFVETATPYGKVRVKIGAWRGRDVTRAPEMEDCLRLARAQGVGIRAVYEAACRSHNDTEIVPP